MRSFTNLIAPFIPYLAYVCVLREGVTSDHCRLQTILMPSTIPHHHHHQTCPHAPAKHTVDSCQPPQCIVWLPNMRILKYHNCQSKPLQLNICTLGCLTFEPSCAV